MSPVSKPQSTSTVTASLPNNDKTTSKTPAAATKAQSAPAEPAPAKPKSEPKKDLDWKKTLKEHGLEEEATVNGNFSTIKLFKPLPKIYSRSYLPFK